MLLVRELVCCLIVLRRWVAEARKEGEAAEQAGAGPAPAAPAAEAPAAGEAAAAEGAEPMEAEEIKPSS